MAVLCFEMLGIQSVILNYCIATVVYWHKSSSKIKSYYSNYLYKADM